MEGGGDPGSELGEHLGVACVSTIGSKKRETREKENKGEKKRREEKRREKNARTQKKTKEHCIELSTA